MKKKEKHHEIDLSEKVAFFAPLLTIFMHIFCCGIPLAMAISSSVFGIYLNIPFFEETPNIDVYIFIFSGIVLMVSYLLYKRSKNCCHEHEKHKFYNKIILIIAASLYFISLLLHLLGYHQKI